MMQFNPTPQLNEALSKAKLAFEPIIADETAAFNTKNGGRIEFDYADLGDIIPAVTKALSENGLAIASQPLPIGDKMYLVTRLLHSSGESLEAYYPLPDPGLDPKGFGSQLTFGRRYNQLCLLDINTVTDEESKKKKRDKARNEMRRELHGQQPVKPENANIVEAMNGGIQSGARVISEAQRKRLWAIAKNNGYSDDGVKALIHPYGYSSSTEIKTSDYDAICAKAGDKNMAPMYNSKATADV
ncbi:MAG TPA: ERF family protein [Thermosynechococcaceae cyanobacterium]|jgi:hypothetical protein